MTIFRRNHSDGASWDNYRSMKPTNPPPFVLRRFPRLPLLALSIFAAGLIQVRAAEPTVKFDVPAGEAGVTLKQFARQAGREIMFPAQSVDTVRTNAVQGEYTVKEGLGRLLAETPLHAIEDTKTGALVVQRLDDPNVARAATGSRRPVIEPKDDAPVVLEEYAVTGSRIPQTEIEGFAPLLTFDRAFIQNSGFATTEEFMRMLPQNFTTSTSGRAGVPNDTVPGVRTPGQSGAGLFGLGANNTLVLIDGQRMPLAANGSASTAPPQGFYDINTIPLGMIERIEVLTDGASAIYGSDATGGVINIILKKGYDETELRARLGGTWHGGAFERGATFTHGFSRGKFRGTVVLDYFDREALFASQRRFSRTANQTANGGADYRTTAGSPIRIFALPGQTLAGLFNPNGTPATNAVAPAGQTGMVTVADFAPTTGQGTTTRYDTTHLQALIHPTERKAFSSNFSYDWRPGTVLSAQVSYGEDYTEVLSVPQATSSQAGNASGGFIPAGNPHNPFGQNLGFVVLHEEMGPRVTESGTDSFRAFVSASVQLPRDWQGQGSVQFASQRLRTANPILNVPLMQAALNRTDPATALNLFGDPRAGRANAPGVYEAIFPATIERSRSDLYSAQLFGRGPVWSLPTGPLQMAVGGEWQQQDRIRTTNVPSIVLPARSRFTRDTWAGFAEISVPIVSPRDPLPLVHALNLQIAGRYEDIENAGTTLNPKYGVRWQPFKPLLVRGSYGTGFRAPAPTEFEQPEITGPQNVFDPRRGESYSVQVTTGANLDLQPETSETYNFGVMLTVPGVKGLSVGLDYSHKEQENLTASFSASVIVANETLFAGRVVRAPQTPVEVVTGLPGRVQTVDASFFNFGFVKVETVDLMLSYDVPWRQWGQFSFRVAASHFLTYNLLLAPGATTGENDLVGTSASFPVKTRGNAYLVWNRGDYGASLLCFYNGGFRQSNNEVASSTTLDVNFSYHWRRFGLRFQGGIGNIFDREPPYVNTALGYQVGSQPGPKQRTYHGSVTYSF